MNRIWVVSLSGVRAIAAFENEENAIDWAVDECDERWGGQIWHTRQKARLFLTEEHTYGDSDAQYFIDLLEVQ